MSARRRSDGGFSLRTAFSAAATGANVQPVAPVAAVRRAPVPNVPASVGGTTSKLSFSLQGLHAQGPSQQQPTSPVKDGGASATPAVNAQLPALALTNAFARPASASAPSSDVTRLNAVIDDLTQRLRKTSDKIQLLENANARTSQSFAHAKTQAAQQINALKAELATVVASEAKLRAELSAKPKVAETSSDPFLSSVRSALEADELEQRAVAAEKKVHEMETRQAQLSSDLDVLEEKRSSLIGAMAGDQEGRSTEQLEALIKKAKTATHKLEQLEDRRTALEDDVARFSALADSRREDAAAAMREATMAGAKVEEHEAHLRLLSDRTKEASAAHEEVLKKTEEAMKRVPVLPNIVNGPEPPGNLNSVKDSQVARVEMAARTAIGVPFHFDVDAPITLGAQAALSTPDQQDEMVQAVVGDLTAYFKNAVMASTPVNHGVGTEAAALALAAA